MKRYTLYLLILLGALITGIVLFFSVLSVWIGISNQQTDGFWTPIVVGSSCSVLILYLFFRLSRYFYRQVHRTDSIDL